MNFDGKMELSNLDRNIVGQRRAAAIPLYAIRTRFAARFDKLAGNRLAFIQRRRETEVIQFLKS